MATVKEYEAFKAYLKTLCLKPDEYMRRIMEWCQVHRF